MRLTRPVAVRRDAAYEPPLILRRRQEHVASLLRSRLPVRSISLTETYRPLYSIERMRRIASVDVTAGVPGRVELWVVLGAWKWYSGNEHGCMKESRGN